MAHVGRKLVGRQMGRDRWAEHELAEVRLRSRVTARREAHRRADADKSAVNLGLARSLADQRSVQRRHKDHLFELHMAVEASEKEHQLRCARALLDERLAVEASMIDQFWLNDVPPQLHWLREPASLRLLLQRPAWLDEWLRGEEERASLLWRRLPNDLILKILQSKRQERRVLKHAPLQSLCVWSVCVCLAASETHTQQSQHSTPFRSNARRAFSLDLVTVDS